MSGASRRCFHGFSDGRSSVILAAIPNSKGIRLLSTGTWGPRGNSNTEIGMAILAAVYGRTIAKQMLPAFVEKYLQHREPVYEWFLAEDVILDWGCKEFGLREWRR